MAHYNKFFKMDMMDFNLEELEPGGKHSEEENKQLTEFICGPNKLEVDFEKSFRQVAKDVHADAVRHGFWPQDRNKGEMIALIHSELSEALECLRFGNLPDKNIHDMSGAEVQLADAVILLMDMSEGYGLNIAAAVGEKVKFNKTREYRHGKTF